jgi:hypothetical protein
MKGTQLMTRADVKGPALYAGIRDDLRKHIIELKKARRAFIGDRVTMVFENRQTLLFQTEEMLRAESITEDDKIQDELDVYNAIMPTSDSLSATLFIELPVGADTRKELGKLVGLDEHVTICIGPHEIRADFEAGRSEVDRISAVQYLRFALTAAAREALLSPDTELKLVFDHPNYSFTVACSEEMRASLANDYTD